MVHIAQSTAEVYTSSALLVAEDQELVLAALKATEAAYAPYSHFRVGAALRLASGQIVCGSNQENAAYPSGLCAERVALFSAFAQFPKEELRAIAIAATSQTQDSSAFVQTARPVTPGGACRQVIFEYATRSSQPVRVLMAGADEIWLVDDARTLLPFAFTL